MPKTSVLVVLVLWLKEHDYAPFFFLKGFCASEDKRKVFRPSTTSFNIAKEA